MLPSARSYALEELRDFLDLAASINPVLKSSKIIDVLVAHILECFAAKR